MKRAAIVFWIGLATLLLGFAASAQRPDAPQFGQRGPYTVGTRDYVLEGTERDLSITIWYPALNPDRAEERTDYAVGPGYRIPGRALRDAPPDSAGAPYPLVVFSHGSGGFRFQSLFFTEHLASYGFVVIAADHPGNTILDLLSGNSFEEGLALSIAHRPFDLLRLIDYANSLSLSDDNLAGLIDTDRVVVSGHSFGGHTALAAAGARLNFDQLARTCDAQGEESAAYVGVCLLLSEVDNVAQTRGFDTSPHGAWPQTTDPRIQAIIALAPWNGPLLDTESLAAIEMPVLFIVGTADSVTPPQRDTYVIHDNLLQAPKTLITLEGANHAVFVDACNELAIQLGLFARCSDPIWDMHRAHDLTNHFSVAFLLANFYGDEAAQAALDTAAVDFPGVGYESVYKPQADVTAVQFLVPEVVASFPHDTTAFTQGLLLHDGLFYESTGRYERSTLREVVPHTGEILRLVELPSEYFGEGLERVDNRLIQLTWREETAFVYDLETFDVIDTFSYEGEGWGLCFDGEVLYMSDGSSMLYTRNLETFDLISEIAVTYNNQPVNMLNELECVGSAVYANVWQTDYIVRIDKVTGYITAVIDASGLLTEQEAASLAAGGVLNGIAYDAASGSFFITGKLWPRMFEVRFIAP
jgi:glutaminyl-peptide cyclotransferase